MTRFTIGQACRSFHISFKGMAPDEIYDVLMEQLLKAVQKYDPRYSEKVCRVVDVLKKKRVEVSFTIDELNKHLDFDGARYVRVLCRHGFLEPAPEETSSKRYRRQAAAWPPPDGYLSAGPVGFTYYLQTWFRYYLQRHIESAFAAIETKEGPDPGRARGDYRETCNRHVQ